MKKPSIELRKYTMDDLSRNPACFDMEVDGHGKLALVDMYGILFTDEKDEAPLYFMHHCNPDNVRFGGISRLGVGYDSVQTPLHLEDIAQKEAIIRPYRKIDETCYGIDCDSPYFEGRFYESHVTLKELDVLNLRFDLFPFAIFKHADESTTISHITQTCELSGVYEGKAVHGIGNFELCHFPRKEQRQLNDFSTYIYANEIGIRKDGKKEIALIFMALNGKGRGFYWLEGEDPVISSEVKMEGSWIRLPYMNDGTCVYEKATWLFGDKKINFIGKWGQKGLTAYPRVELGGQSQVHGSWYEGDEPYEHVTEFTFNEHIGVYDHVLKENGFTVLDM